AERIHVNTTIKLVSALFTRPNVRVCRSMVEQHRVNGVSAADMAVSTMLMMGMRPASASHVLSNDLSIREDGVDIAVTIGTHVLTSNVFIFLGVDSRGSVNVCPDHDCTCEMNLHT